MNPNLKPQFIRRFTSSIGMPCLVLPSRPVKVSARRTEFTIASSVASTAPLNNGVSAVSSSIGRLVEFEKAMMKSPLL